MGNTAGERVLVTKAEYARHRNCKPPYVSKLCRQGRLVEVNGMIDRDASDLALAGSADPTRAAVVESNAKRYAKTTGRIQVDAAEREIMANLPKVEPPSPPPKVEKAMSYTEAKTAREVALGERARWDLEVEQGKYVPRETAARLAFEAGRGWRDQIAAVQTTLPTTITALVKRHLPSASADAVQLLQHAVAQAVEAAHREALDAVAKQIGSMAESLETEQQ